MRLGCRKSIVNCGEPVGAMAQLSEPVRRRSAFTLFELLVVITIIALMAGIAAPTFRHFAKGDATVSATRQLLDDVGRARQMAISQRTTVYMVFLYTNFCLNNNWGAMTPPALLARVSPVLTNMLDEQLTGYTFVTLHSLGDQPGQPTPRYLASWQTLPNGYFIAEQKFTTPANQAYTVYTNGFVKNPTKFGFVVNGFLYTNTIPFPTTDTLQSTTAITPTWLPYIAFNSLGQLIGGDGQPLGRDEYIPLAQGSVLPGRDPVTKVPGFVLNGSAFGPLAAASIEESPAGNSTNNYNLIHIDWLTGHATLEHPEVQ